MNFINSQVSVVCAAHGHSMMDPIVYWVKGIGVRHSMLMMFSEIRVYVPYCLNLDLDRLSD